jgi:hypothetical protein
MDDRKAIRFELSKETVAVLRTAGRGKNDDKLKLSLSHVVPWICTVGSNDSPPTCCR